MANVRFKIAEFGGVRHIVDRTSYRVFPFGPGPYAFFEFPGTHRCVYTEYDAQNVCEMLNEREVKS
jgi:hypothetical protein